MPRKCSMLEALLTPHSIVKDSGGLWMKVAVNPDPSFVDEDVTIQISEGGPESQSGAI